MKIPRFNIPPRDDDDPTDDKIRKAIPELEGALSILRQGQLNPGLAIEPIDCRTPIHGIKSKPSTLARQNFKYWLGRLDDSPPTKIPFADEIEVKVRGGFLHIKRRESSPTDLKTARKKLAELRQTIRRMEDKE